MNLFLNLLIPALCPLLFWPRIGLVGRWRRMREMSVRVLREDSLKRIYKMQVNGGRPTLQGIAGTLHIHPNRAAGLLTDMERRVGTG